jgi:hypothetical protein
MAKLDKFMLSLFTLPIFINILDMLFDANISKKQNNLTALLIINFVKYFFCAPGANPSAAHHETLPHRWALSFLCLQIFR